MDPDAPATGPALAAPVSRLFNDHTSLSIASTAAVGNSAPPEPGHSTDLHQVYDSLVGQTVDDRFEVQQLLGYGAMAAVYHVRDKRPDATHESGTRFRSHNDEYALKLFLPGLTPRAPTRFPSGNLTQRFVREFRMGQRHLSSSGRIVHTFHFGAATLPLRIGGHSVSPSHAASAHTAYYFTMNLVRGGSLPRATSPQPIEAVAALGLELLTALDELHTRHIVHRDLTLGNVLLTAPWQPSTSSPDHHPRVVLADLGIAKHGAVRHDNPLGHVLGTPAFLPPESLTLGNLDPRADLYAVGVILYWLAAGQHPLEAAGYPAEHAYSGAPYCLKPLQDLAPDCPPILAGAIMMLLARDPCERPKTAALAHDLLSVWCRTSGRASLPTAPQLRGSPYLCQAAFVGRGPELRQAENFLRDTLVFRPPDSLTRERLPAHHREYRATHLPPTVLTISGPPGVGKSRLLAEISTRASAFDALVLRGQFISGGAPALHGITAVLDDLLRLADAVSLDRFNTTPSASDGYCRRLTSLEHIPTEQDEAYALLRQPATGPDEERVRARLQRQLLMAQAAARLLLVSRDHPILIVQEDCHWLDESSTGMLAYLLEGVALARSQGHPARVAFVLTHRHAEEGNAVSRLYSALDQLAELQRPTIRLDLEGMAPDEVAALCASLLQAPVDTRLSDFARGLFAEPTTRPLYVEQVLRALLDAGVLTDGMYSEQSDGNRRWTGAWNLDPTKASRAPKPANVHEAIGRNVEQLSPGTATALMYAAAAGSEFDLDIVAHAAGFEPFECLDFLDEATGAGFIADLEPLALTASASRTEGRRFAFRHDRFQEAIYRASSEATRTHCHARLVQAILAVRGDLPETAEALAQHYGRSGQHERAYVCATQAADFATRTHAYDHAAELYGQALVFATKASIEPPTTLRVAVVNASVSAGFYNVASQHLFLLSQDQRASPKERLAANLQLAELKHRQQDYRNAVQPLTQALHHLGDPFPRSRWLRRVLFAWRVIPVIACGLWPRLVNLRPARDAELAELRIRAWYSLSECLYFVDFKDSPFLMATVGKLVVSSGVHGSTPLALAAVGLGMAVTGHHRLAWTYISLARRTIPLVRRLDPRDRATIHMLNTSSLLLGGKVGEAYQAEHQIAAGEGIRAAHECHDPQRLWTTTMVTAAARRAMGHLQTYERLLSFVIERATESRLFYIARLHDLKLRTIMTFAARDYDNAYKLGEAGAQLAQAHGAYAEAAECRATACWARALQAADAVAPDASLIHACLDTARTYLARHLHDVAHWPLSQCLAALVICQRQGADPSATRDLRRACHSHCLRDRKETPLYLAACATLHVVEGRQAKGARLLRAALDTACQQEALPQLLEIYRLAAAIYPEGSAERRVYKALDDQLTTALTTAPSPSLDELLQGHLAPRIKPPCRPR